MMNDDRAFTKTGRLELEDARFESCFLLPSAGNAGNSTQPVRTITKAPGSVPRCERETSLVSNDVIAENFDDADEDSMNKDSSNQHVKM